MEPPYDVADVSPRPVGEARMRYLLGRGPQNAWNFAKGVIDIIDWLRLRLVDYLIPCFRCVRYVI